MSDDFVTIKGRRYPSRYYPGSGNKDLDEAWTILDSVKDGVIPDDVRAYLAGQITGVIARIRLEETRKYSLPFA